MKWHKTYLFGLESDLSSDSIKSISLQLIQWNPSHYSWPISPPWSCIHNSIIVSIINTIFASYEVSCQNRPKAQFDIPTLKMIFMKFQWSPYYTVYCTFIGMLNTQNKNKIYHFPYHDDWLKSVNKTKCTLCTCRCNITPQPSKSPFSCRLAKIGGLDGGSRIRYSIKKIVLIRDSLSEISP